VRTGIPLCLLAAAAAWAQTPAQPEPATVGACVSAIDKLGRDAVRKSAFAAKCVDRFPLAKTSGTDLLDLAVLFAEMDRHNDARAAIEKRLSEPGLTDAQKGDALDGLITASQRGTVADEIRPRSIKTTEDVAPRLEKLGDDATWQKLVAYRWLTSYYRGDPDENGKVFHASSRFFELYPKLTPEKQKDSLAQFGLYCAYEDLAGVYSSRGDNARAMALVREGIEKVQTASLSTALKKTLLHYELVGKAAPAISAPIWINAPADNSVNLQGRVTVVEFTAHWCIPCKETYPSLVNLQKKFASRGVQVMLATSLYGYFGKERPLTQEQELAADRKYYLEENHLSMPVAVASKSAEDMNSQSYGVQSIPLIVVIDRTGTVRHFLNGVTPSDEAALSTMIEELLKP
jgi:thiol-disulfide isomerase/thioredoxin